MQKVTHCAAVGDISGKVMEGRWGGVDRGGKTYGEGWVLQILWYAVHSPRLWLAGSSSKHAESQEDLGKDFTIFDKGGSNITDYKKLLQIFSAVSVAMLIVDMGFDGEDTVVATDVL